MPVKKGRVKVSPVSYSQGVADELCERIASGESLKSICRDWHLPSERAVHKWLTDGEHSSFVQQYVHARERQADFYADDIIRIADDCFDPQKARVQIDARKWKASKMAPKKYGDRLDIEHSGSVNTMSDEQIDAKIAAFLSKSNAKPV